MRQQKCLVSSKNYDKAVEVAVKTANSTTVGDPQGEFRIGPIANKPQYEKILKMIEIGFFLSRKVRLWLLGALKSLKVTQKVFM